MLRNLKASIIFMAWIGFSSVNCHARPIGIDTKTLQEIGFIEETVVLPYDAKPLFSYIRFYSRIKASDGKAMIKGTYFLLSDWSRAIAGKGTEIGDLPNAYLIDEIHLPEINDGGCSTLSVFYDVQSRTLKGYPGSAFSVFGVREDKTVNGFCNGVG